MKGLAEALVERGYDGRGGVRGFYRRSASCRVDAR